MKLCWVVVFSEKYRFPNVALYGGGCKVERFCLPAITIHARSHMTFQACHFSIVSYMRLLFQLQGHHCFFLSTKQWIIRAFIWNSALEAFHLNCPSCYATWPAWRQRAEKQLLMWVVFKKLFSKLCVHKQCSQCSCSCVETLVILQAKFHVVSSLLTRKQKYGHS